jgi:hypothetical protein
MGGCRRFTSRSVTITLCPPGGPWLKNRDGAGAREQWRPDLIPAIPLGGI